MPEIGLKTEPRKFTYADYVTWATDERWEIIDGEALAMSPAPAIDHQRISRELCFQIHAFLTDKACEMFQAPVDVLLPKPDEPDEMVSTVLQPDVFVVCDRAKITRSKIRGAPDFVIEILSPTTASRDHVRKRRLYEAHGVREFWLVDPENRLVTVYRQVEANRFGPAEILDGEDLHLDIPMFPGLTIDFGKVFPKKPPVVRESPATYL